MKRTWPSTLILSQANPAVKKTLKVLGKVSHPNKWIKLEPNKANLAQPIRCTNLSLSKMNSKNHFRMEFIFVCFKVHTIIFNHLYFIITICIL